MPLPRSVRLLLLARVVNRLGAFSLPFLTTLISTDYAASVTTAGLVTAAFGAATIPSRLMGGRLADLVGRRFTVVLGLGGCAAAQLGVAASRSLVAVIGCAVLLGLAFELYEPPSQAIISESVPAEQRVQAFSLFSAALAAGGMGAGLLAAVLGHWDLRWLFVADAVTCLACAALVGLALPPDRPPRRHVAPTASGDAPARPLRDRSLLVMLLTGSAYALVNQQTVMSLPLTLARQGRPAADAGLLFSAAALTTVLAQPLIRLPRVARMSAPAALALGHLLLAAGLLGYAVARSLAAEIGASVVWSLGDLLIMGRAYALVAGLAPPGASGRYLAVFGVSWGIAATLAPVLGTQLVAHAGATTLWTATAGFCLALSGVHLRVTPGRGHSGPAREGSPAGTIRAATSSCRPSSRWPSSSGGPPPTRSSLDP